MKINYKYLISFVVLLVIEILIAIFVKDTLIRPFIGDILIIILMYTFIKTFLGKQIKFLSIYLFIFATSVEVSQYFNIVDRLSLSDNKILSIVLGNTFDKHDIICYFIGALILMIWEMYLKSKCRNTAKYKRGF